MIFGITFDTQPSQGNIDRVRRILMERFGLVPPKNDPVGRNESEVLVWEDESGIGRYRVYLFPEVKRNGNTYDAIVFKYWTNSRMRREVFEADPMKTAFDCVRGYLSGTFIERPSKDVSIEQLLLDK